MKIWGNIFALGYDRLMASTENAGLRTYRENLLRAASRRVLEIGGGTGANLPFYGGKTGKPGKPGTDGTFSRGRTSRRSLISLISSFKALSRTYLSGIIAARMRRSSLGNSLSI